MADRPTIQEWTRGMDLYMAAESTTYRSRGCPKTFHRIWDPWRRHFGLDIGDDTKQSVTHTTQGTPIAGSR